MSAEPLFQRKSDRVVQGRERTESDCRPEKEDPTGGGSESSSCAESAKAESGQKECAPWAGKKKRGEEKNRSPSCKKGKNSTSEEGARAKEVGREETEVASTELQTKVKRL